MRHEALVDEGRQPGYGPFAGRMERGLEAEKGLFDRVEVRVVKTALTQPGAGAT